MHKKNLFQIGILLILFVLFGSALFLGNTSEINSEIMYASDERFDIVDPFDITNEDSNINDFEIAPKQASYDNPILIDGNSDFNQKASQNGWEGLGTYHSPYIIENYTIIADSDKHGIDIRNTDVFFILKNVTVSNGFSNYNYGFYFNNVSDAKIMNNTADGNLAGFLLKDSKNNTLTDNIAIDCYHGIRIWNSRNNTLNNNKANENLIYGIFIDNSTDITAHGNMLLNNTVEYNGESGIYLKNSDNITLNGNTANFNNQGIYLYSSFNNNLKNNTANGNTDYGVFLENCNNNTIFGNILRNNTAQSNGKYGFYIKDSTNTTLTKNIANSNQQGFYLLRSHNNTIINNTANLNSKYGIYLESSNDSSIFENIIWNNGLGCIFEKDCSGNTISNNLCTPEPFVLDSPFCYSDPCKKFLLNWTDSNYAINYTIFVNDSAVVGMEGIIETEFNVSISEDGIYGLYVVAFNDYGNISSNEVSITLNRAPSSFQLSSTAKNPDKDGDFVVKWTEALNIKNYTLYQNGLEIAVITNLNLFEFSISDLSTGLYNYTMIAFNQYGNITSNTILVNVVTRYFINGNDGFKVLARANGWEGNGTSVSPYFIEDLKVDASKHHGFYIQNSNVHFILNNITATNGKNKGYAGIYLKNVKNAEVIKCKISDNECGIFLEKSDDNDLSENFANSNNYGFFLEDSDSNDLIKNNAKKNVNGISLKDSNHNKLKENTITLNRHGLSLDSSKFNTLTENLIIDNRYLGVFLTLSNNNTLNENNSSKNLNGFTLSISKGNLITDNIANNNERNGFHLIKSNFTIISNNIANYNGKYGIYLDACVNNNIFGNIFKGNSQGDLFEEIDLEEQDGVDLFLIGSFIFLILGVLFFLFKCGNIIKPEFLLDKIKIKTSILIKKGIIESLMRNSYFREITKRKNFKFLKIIIKKLGILKNVDEILNQKKLIKKTP